MKKNIKKLKNNPKIKAINKADMKSLKGGGVVETGKTAEELD